MAIFSVLNLMSNAWQSWAYRADLGPSAFVTRFALGGGLGVAAGSFLLASLSTEILLAGLACVVFFYIGLRLLRPGWKIARERGEGWAGRVGFVGGIMQGAGGISAPISLTFLNAMKLERREFIATIAVFFFMMAAFQVPSLAAFNILTWELAGLGVLAAIPLFGSMPLGEMAARKISREAFDRLILLLLVAVALRLLYAAFA